MEKTKDKMNEKLNEELVVSSTVTKHKEEKNMKKRTMAMIFAMVMAFVVAGCGKETQQPAPVVAATVEPTKEAVPTEVTVEPTKEAEPTAEPTQEPAPTEVVVEDNPNIIDGFDFTKFNNDGTWIGFAMHDADCDEPRVIVTRKDDNGQEVVAILSDGESFTQDDGEFVYYVYAPQAVKAVNFNEKMIDFDVDGVTVTRNHIQIMEDDAFENDGVQYSKTYSFWYNSHALVTDDCVFMLLEYEDGTDDTMGVFITTE